MFLILCYWKKPRRALNGKDGRDSWRDDMEEHRMDGEEEEFVWPTTTEPSPVIRHSLSSPLQSPSCGHAANISTGSLRKVTFNDPDVTLELEPALTGRAGSRGEAGSRALCRCPLGQHSSTHKFTISTKQQANGSLVNEFSLPLRAPGGFHAGTFPL
ncbi:unnamed protein product [Pleuronectes platessa]|uniref:Uncharacterized protein n=1 Tax=Pleuronectes platessa TaxID=8262 RepID=A0A9N7UKK8_PLEPL|nr:unnamed protein product [Pleuronectes platessa]